MAVIGRLIETERARGVLEASRGLVSGRDGAGLITYTDSSGTELIGLREDLCWLRRHSGRRRLEPPTAVRMRHSGRAPQLPEGRCVSRTERFERARASYVPDEPPPATRGSRCDPSGTVFASLRGPPVDMMQDELRKPMTRAERAAEWCNSHHVTTDDGCGPLDVNGKRCGDGSTGSRLVLRLDARRQVEWRGGKKT